MAGSLLARPAFIGKSVFGRKTVSRQSGFLSCSSDMSRRGLSDMLRRGKAAARRLAVRCHLRLEGIDAVEARFVAPERDQLDLERAAVNLLVEIEEIRLEQLPRRIEGGAGAEIGGAFEGPGVGQGGGGGEAGEAPAADRRWGGCRDWRRLRGSGRRPGGRGRHRCRSGGADNCRARYW